MKKDKKKKQNVEKKGKSISLTTAAKLQLKVDY